MVVGENLGTVPPEVNEAMARHGVLRLRVCSSRGTTCSDGGFRPPAGRDGGHASNTHDTATFAAFWSGADLADRPDLGLLDDDGLRRRGERAAGRSCAPGCADLARPRTPERRRRRAVLRGVARALAESDAALVVVNVEDCWVESRARRTCRARPTSGPTGAVAAAAALEAWDDRPGWRASSTRWPPLGPDRAPRRRRRRLEPPAGVRGQPSALARARRSGGKPVSLRAGVGATDGHRRSRGLRADPLRGRATASSRITLNRPERLNAFTGQMRAEMIDAFDRADADDDVRAIIVTGAGRGFCAGADLGKGADTFNYDDNPRGRDRGHDLGARRRRAADACASSSSTSR